MSAKEIFDHFREEGQVIKKAPFAFVSCVLICGIVIFFGIGWLEEWHYGGIITEKEATITTVSAERDASKTDNDRLARQNEQLRNENAAYAAAHSEKSSPLKNRAIILAKQLSEYADLVKTNENDNSQAGFQKRGLYQGIWQVRFEPRVSEILKELDVQGQSSDYLPMGVQNANYSDITPTADQTKMIASEINRMANSLPEIAPP